MYWWQCSGSELIDAGREAIAATKAYHNKLRRQKPYMGCPLCMNPHGDYEI